MWLSSRVVWPLALLFCPAQSYEFGDVFFHDIETLAGSHHRQSSGLTASSATEHELPAEDAMTDLLFDNELSKPKPTDKKPIDHHMAETSTSEPWQLDDTDWEIMAAFESLLDSSKSSNTKNKPAEVSSSSSGLEKEGFQAVNSEPGYALDIGNSNHIHGHGPIATEAHFTAGGHQSGVPIQLHDNQHEIFHENPINSLQQEQKSKKRKKSAKTPIMRPDSSTFQVAYGSPSLTQKLTPLGLRNVLPDSNSIWLRIYRVYKKTTETVWLAKKCEKHTIFDLFEGADPENFRAMIDAWRRMYLDGPDETSFATDLRPRADWSDLLYSDPLAKILDHKHNFKNMKRLAPALWAQHSEAIKFFVKDPIFLHKDAWYSAKVLRHLDKIDHKNFQRSIGWFRKKLPSYDDRINRIWTLEQEVFDGLFQQILNSFELRFPDQLEKESKLPRLRAIVEARKAWYYALEEDKPEDGIKKHIHEHIKALRPKEYEKKEELLRKLTDDTVNYISQQLIEEMQKKEIDKRFITNEYLPFWNLYHDDSYPIPEVQQGVQKIFDDPNHSKKARELLHGAEVIRRRTQAEVTYWLPLAFEGFFQKDKRNDPSTAAKAFLRVRKDLEDVLTYSSTERNIFKEELIAFVGVKQYNARIRQLTEISDALGEMMYIYKLFSEDTQDRLIEDQQAFEIRHRLDSFMTSYYPKINLETQTEFLEYYPHLSPKEARVSLLKKINQGAENYRMSVLEKAYIHAQNFQDILDEKSRDCFVLFDRVRSLTSEEDWKSSLQKMANKYDLAEHQLLNKFEKFESDGKDSIRLLHWKSCMELLEIQMTEEFMAPLRDIEKHLGLILGERKDVIPFHPYEEEVMLTLKTLPHHYLLKRTIEGILGRDFSHQKLNQAFGSTRFLHGHDFELTIPVE